MMAVLLVLVILAFLWSRSIRTATVVGYVSAALAGQRRVKPVVTWLRWRWDRIPAEAKITIRHLVARTDMSDEDRALWERLPFDTPPFQNGRP